MRELSTICTLLSPPLKAGHFLPLLPRRGSCLGVQAVRPIRMCMRLGLSNRHFAFIIFGTARTDRECSMSSRTASCYCGQLRIQVQGEPWGVGVCSCLACQRRTGSVFATLANFPTPFRATGTATEFLRVGDQGARFRFRFCPICGTHVFHSEDGNDESVSVAVGAFADPNFPAPGVSVYDCRRHPWVQLPAGIKTFQKDPTSCGLSNSGSSLSERCSVEL